MVSAGPKLDLPDHLVLGALLAGLGLPSVVDEPAGDRNLPALRQMLGAGVSTGAERVMSMNSAGWARRSLTASRRSKTSL